MNLEQVQAKIKELTNELAKDDTGSAALDARENADLDRIREEIAFYRTMEESLLKAKEMPIVPGTWNLGDTILITYTKVVAYGKERPLPEPFTATLVATTSIEKMDFDAGHIELPINTKIAQTILHKASTEFKQIKTPNGYVDILVESAPKKRGDTQVESQDS